MSVSTFEELSLTSEVSCQIILTERTKIIIHAAHGAMNYLMDRKKPSTKKKIKVRKSPISPIVSNTGVDDDDEDYYIPVAALDSAWSGISFREPERINIEHAQGLIEEETEIRVIDCDTDNNKEATPPLLLLFPDLRKEDSERQLPIMKGEISTTSLTRLLIGKKPKMSLLKPSKKPIQKHSKLSAVEEDTESDESIKVLHDFKNKTPTAKESSNFADISSNDRTSLDPSVLFEKNPLTASHKKRKSHDSYDANSDKKLANSDESNSATNDAVPETIGAKVPELATESDDSHDADISSMSTTGSYSDSKERQRTNVHRVSRSKTGGNANVVKLESTEENASE